MTLIEVRNRLRDLCEEAGSIRKWSDANRISFGYVAQVIRGDAKPSVRLLKKIRIERKYTFKKLPDYRD